MHIEDWDETFPSRLDPKNYVKMLKLAGVKSAMVYANSHVGYCYWPIGTGVCIEELR
jgi:alpha-L-fucosidase